VKNFIVYDTSGTILRTGTCTESDFSLQAGENETVIEGNADDATQLIVNGEVTAKSEPSDAEKNAAVMEELRRIRNKALAWCDWTQFADSPLNDSLKAQWVTYRSSLRDVPATNANVTSMEDVVWPTKP
jgi:hypothetical protein